MDTTDIVNNKAIALPVTSLSMDINCIAQPPHSTMCGAYCLAMIYDYYKKPHLSPAKIFRKISECHLFSRRIGRVSKMVSHANRAGLCATAIRFTDLKLMLELLADACCPAILNHHTFADDSGLGHFTVFRGLDGNNVFLCDPELPNASTRSIADLVDRFVCLKPDDEIAGNVLIVISNRLGCIRAMNCQNMNGTCGGVIVFRDWLMGAKCVKHLLCEKCDRWNNAW